MKKLTLFLFLLCIPFFVYAESCNTDNIAIKSVSLSNKTENVVILHEPVVDKSNNIHLDFNMSEIGDNVVYDILVKNNSDKKVTLDDLKTKSKYFKYNLSTDDKSNVIKGNSEKIVHLAIKYDSPVPDDNFEDYQYHEKEPVVINILQTGKDNIVNPPTGRSRIIIGISVLLVTSIFVFVVIKKNNKFFSCLFLLLLIPISVYASCKININVETKIGIIKQKPAFLMRGDPNPATSNYLNTNVAKQDIEKITFANSFSDKCKQEECFDVSFDRNRSVLAWFSDTDNDGKKEMTIEADGNIYVYNGHSLFANLSNLESIEGMKYLDTSKTKDLTNMFGLCKNLTSIDLGHFDTSKVEDISSMFYGCEELKILNLSNFNTSKVKNMYSLFTDCKNLTTINLSSLDTSNVTDMSRMFSGCKELTVLDLNSFDTSKVENTSSMFKACDELKTIYVSNKFVTDKVTESSEMFKFDSVLVGGAGTEYDENHTDKEYAIIDEGINNPGYFTLGKVNVATVYYNSNSEPGEFTLSKKIVYCTLEEGQNTCEITIPNAVSSSVGKYNSTFKGLSKNLNSMTLSNLKINDGDNLYAVYQEEVTSYVVDNGNGDTQVLYRNEFFIEDNDIHSIISDNVNGIKNIEWPTSSDFLGFSVSEEANVTFDNINDVANSSYTSLYGVYKATITYEKGNHVLEIGKESDSCNYSYYSVCYVTLPSITQEEGYDLIGWVDEIGNTYNVNSNYELNGNITLYANGKIASYLNTNTGIYYETLKDAVNSVRDNQTIKTLRNTVETTMISPSHSITLDLNGYKISMGEYYFTNNKTLTIKNTSSSQGSIEGSGSNIVNNAGTLTVQDNIIFSLSSSGGACIFNYGTATINGGIIRGKTGILNSSNGKLFVNGSSTQIIGTGVYGLENRATATINDGTITGSKAILNEFDKILNINGGTINGSSIGLHDTGGTVKITGGTIIGSNYGIINGSSTNQSGNVRYSKITMTGGEINGGQVGVEIPYKTTFILGEDDGNISTSSPVVQSSGYGVKIESSGSFKFYDGIVKSSSGTGYAIDGYASYPTDCSVYKETVDGVESAYIVKTGLLMAGDSNGSSYNFLRTTVAKKDIEKIIFTNSFENHSIDEENCWDVSKNQNESVLAWITDIDSNEKYEMTIGAMGVVYASSGSHLFDFLSNLRTIEGMEYFNTSKVTTMTFMFAHTGLESLDLKQPSFDTSSVTNMNKMFGASGIRSLDLTGSNFNTSRVTDMSGMFTSCGNLTSVNLNGENFNTSRVTDMNGMFSNSGLTSLDLKIENFNTSNVTNMSSMFAGLTNLTELDLTGSNFNTSKVRNMSSMFSQAHGLTNVLFGSNFDTSRVIDMSSMFWGADHLTMIDISDDAFNTKNVTNMIWIFRDCSSITTVLFGKNFDTSNVTSLTFMFNMCTNLRTIDFSGSKFNTSKVTNMSRMFFNCYNLLSVDFGDEWDTSKVTTTEAMFYRCNKLTTINLGNKFDTSKTTNMSSMFSGCSSLTTIYAPSSFVTTAVTNSDRMFDGCTSLVGGAGTVFSSSHINHLYAHIDEGTTNPGYFTDGRKKTATIYYNGFNNEGYGLRVNTIEATCNAENESCTISIPTEVSNSIGKYKGEFKGVSNSINSMNSSSLTISENTTFYAIYSNEVTNYYYDETEYKTRTLYRNEFFTSTSGMGVALASDINGTNNIEVGNNSGPNNAWFEGFATSQTTNTSFDNVEEAASNHTNQLYSVYSYSVNFAKGANVSEIGSTTSGCEFTYGDSSCAIILPSITPNEDYTSVGWSTTSGATSGSDAGSLYILTSNSITLYANAAHGILMGGTSNQGTNYLRTTIIKDKIESITFSNSISGHTANETDCWDVSKDQNKTVLAWVTDTDTNGLYEMTIGANGIVYLSRGNYLFANLRELNSINGWNNIDTSDVTTMSGMFYYTGSSSTSFTLDLGDKFDTSNVTDMYYMFDNTGYSSTIFTLDLGDKFDTSKVTRMDRMFAFTGYKSTVFTLDLGDKFDTSNVINMGSMFYNTGYNSTVFTLDLGDKFDTSNVTNMVQTFYKAGYSNTSFTLNLGDKFDTSKVTRMDSMFAFTGYKSTVFTLNLGDKFDTSNVTNMYSMFQSIGYSNTTFTLDLGDKFNTSNVTNMGDMFIGSRYLKTIYVNSDFNTSSLTNSNDMFTGCTSLVGGNGTTYNSNNIDATYAKIDRDGTPGYFTKKSYLMEGNSGNSTSNYLRTNIKKEDIELLTFANSISGHTVNGTDCWDVSKDEDGGVLAWVTDNDSNGKYEMTIAADSEIYLLSGSYLFSYLINIDSINNIQYLNTSRLTNMYCMFNETGRDSSSFTLDLGSKFDTSNVTNMVQTFYKTGYSNTSFTLNLGNKFDTSNVTNMDSMFSKVGYNSSIFTLNLGDKFDTSKVTKMTSMFQSVGISNSSFTLNLGDKFDTSNVTSMASMFSNVGGRSLNLGNKFDTSNVKTMSLMFAYTGYNSRSYTLNLEEKFDTSSVTSMDYMFVGTGFGNIILGSKFNTSNVENMKYMFKDAEYVKKIYAPNSFVVTNTTSSTDMFKNCSALVGGVGTVFNSSHIDGTYAHIDGGESNPGYFTDINSI